MRHVQVGANGGFVLVAEPFVDILIHERGLTDAGIMVKNTLIIAILRTNPLSPRIITCIVGVRQRLLSPQQRNQNTLRRTRPIMLS